MTAVEWFAKQTLSAFISNEKFNELLEQAKEMEKEQIKYAFVECWKANAPDGIECKLDAEQYYNETFKSE